MKARDASTVRPRALTACLAVFAAVLALGCSSSPDSYVPDAGDASDLSDSERARPLSSVDATTDDDANIDASGPSVLPDAEPLADSDIDAGPPSHPVSQFCGDGIRDPVTEECDDGIGAPGTACTPDCRVREIPLVDAQSAPAIDGAVAQRTLGGAPHVSAATDAGFAAVYTEITSATAVRMQSFDPSGVPQGTPLDVAGDSAPLSPANPALAPLPSNRYAVAWTDGTDGPPEVRMRIVDGETLGAARLAHASTAGSHADADLLWVGDRLVAAWTNVLAIEYRSFDADLTPLGPEVELASSTAIQSHVSLCPFANSWAAAFRAGDQGLESIVVQTGTTSWSTPPGPLGPVDDRPALVALDDMHMLLVYAVGTDPTDSGTATVGRLRAAVLGLDAPGVVQSFAVTPAQPPYSTDPTLIQHRPSAARVGDQQYVAWESSSQAGEQVFVTRVTLDPGSPNGVRLDEEMLLPFPTGGGWQSNAHLGVSTLFPGGALISVWETASDGTSRATTDVNLDFRPSPFVFLPSGDAD